MSVINLSQSVSGLPNVGPSYSKRLNKLGIVTVEDLLNHVPSRYKDLRKVSKISQVRPTGEEYTVKAKLTTIKNIYTRNRKKLQIGEIADSTGFLNVVWFNQTYLTSSLDPETEYYFSGKSGIFNNKVSLMSPEHERSGGQRLHSGRIVPIYPETYGVSSRWLRSRIHPSLELVEQDVEFLPSGILKKYNLLDYKKSLTDIHFPNSPEDIEPAKKRLALNELLIHQLTSLLRKSEWKKSKISPKVTVDQPHLKNFLGKLPFKLTKAQEKAVTEILNDLQKDSPMNRLLEGDVGSGKTVVAAIGAFAVFLNGYQSVIMAPTQILAQQHFDVFKKLFGDFGVRISLITADVKDIALGRTDIFIGTHSLIHKKVSFDNVAYVVIDEQHRFGVEQRTHLVQLTHKQLAGKTLFPNVLTMTATPIPRTVALTVYGDLDLSVLDEIPKNRQKITTWIVPSAKRSNAYDWIKKEVSNNKIQVFVVCPLIEESSSETLSNVKAATKEYSYLKREFKNLKLGLLHGRQKSKEKADVLDKFRKGKIDILVSTPVVEVGIDIPNATIIVIEAAERYGLAQLHQLRGRVGRGTKKSHCLIFTESKSENVKIRLQALTKDMSGFELSELDLKMRGPGEIFGLRQHGFEELKIASWSDSKLIKLSRELAETLITNKVKVKSILAKTTSRLIIEN